ncbi:MAG TPA: imidazoleglycerol-phosphate dehydratase HisB [Thermomicrobiales bacterium]|nr:imidazoleglycerol-phosphate dehydratase HisB [Thermomicrobiales bacterium]
MSGRTGSISRTTSETSITVLIDLDDASEGSLSTGVGFFDHMLHALARHGRFGLTVDASGDLHIDAHHTVEDVGIALGQAFRKALGDRVDIERYGHAYAPLDEALARVVIDCSGRPFLEFNATFPEASIGEQFDASLIEEFWRGFAVHAGLTIHIDLLRARNSHHAAEAIFKAGAISLRTAVRQTGSGVPSTKGVLQ